MTAADITFLVFSCGVSLFIEMILLFDSYSTHITGAVEIKKFQHMILAGMFQSLTYAAEFVFLKSDYFGSRTCGMVSNSMLFIGNILFVIAFADFEYYKYEKKLYHLRVNKHVFLAPVSCLIVLSALNCFIPVFFDFAADTLAYMETSWVHLVNAVSLIYIAFAGINDIVEMKKNTKYSSLPLSLYFIPAIGGIILEAFFVDVPIVPVMCCTSMMVMYMRILKRIGYVDVLSGVFTRSQMSIYIGNLLGKASQKEKIAGIMLDVNRFKFINDTYGHTVGDIAIQTVGDILRKTTKKKGMCFRYGGDEFVVILKITDLCQIEALIEQINEEARDFNEKKTQVFDLSISQGYAIYDTKNDSVITFVERMDAEMYKNKRASR